MLGEDWRKKRVLVVIILYILYSGLVLILMALQPVDRLYQKILRYQHHYLNYENSIRSDVIPHGLQIKKSAQIERNSPDFEDKWNNVLLEAERKLVSLLLDESRVVGQALSRQLDELLYRTFPNSHESERQRLVNRNANYEQELRKRRSSKWRKFYTRRRCVNQQRPTISNFVAVALYEHESRFKNVTDNRTVRDRRCKVREEWTSGLVG